MEPRQIYPARKSLLGPILAFAVVTALVSVLADGLYLGIFVQPWITDVLLMSWPAILWRQQPGWSSLSALASAGGRYRFGSPSPG
jgi:hypothetical protein